MKTVFPVVVLVLALSGFGDAARAFTEFPMCPVVRISAIGYRPIDARPFAKIAVE